jgi:hypothetical protein
MSETVHYDPDRFERIFVQDQRSLAAAVERLSPADALGIDLEMGQRVERHPGGLQEWVHVLALIQIATETVSVVVDPLRATDLSVLRPLMTGPARKVFLGGGQDAALLQRAGIPALNIVDVGEIALAVFGRREDGMAALARRIFGISLDKTVRRTDWLARPLDHTLIAYAHRDAELTLLIYRWMQEHYSEAVRLHEREELDAQLADSTAPWIKAAVARSSSDALAVVMELGIDPERDREALTEDMRVALAATSAPRLVNRLVRLSADLGLGALVPAILPLTESHSSLIRTAAARALGTLAGPEAGEESLLRLKEDPIAEVRSAADSALKELRSPREAYQPEPVADEPGLDGSALSALQRLMEAMQAEER